MRETTVQFGSDKALVGVLTDAAAEANGLGIVFLNAGFTHHVGPQRLHVRLARRLAALGFTALRFDYSGIGDSPRRQGQRSFAERAVTEAEEALDLLRATRGIERSALFGLCWGADNAVRVAAADARVVGVAAVDFYAVLSARYLVRFYLRRLLSPRSWGNVLRGRSAVFGRLRQLVESWTNARPPLPKDLGGAVAAAQDLLPVQPPAQVLGEIERLVERGVHMAFAYATVGGSYDRYVIDFRRRMRELGTTGRLRVRVFEAADHIFTTLQSQAALGDFVEEWARDVARSTQPGA
jgi:hypothetical protein